MRDTHTGSIIQIEKGVSSSGGGTLWMLLPWDCFAETHTVDFPKPGHMKEASELEHLQMASLALQQWVDWSLL